MKSQLIAALSALIFVITLTPNLTAGEDHSETHHRVKVVMADGGSDAQVIELDGDELAVGESRQIITDSGKEIVITRQEDGFNVTIDGEEIDIPSGLGDHGHHSARIIKELITTEDLGEDGKTVVMLGGDGEHVDVQTEIRKVIVGHGGTAEGIFISEDGETTTLEGEDLLQWTGRLPHLIGMVDSGLADHLESSGAFDDLSDEQRQKILDSIDSYKSSVHGETKVMVLDLDKDEQL